MKQSEIEAALVLEVEALNGAAHSLLAAQECLKELLSPLANVGELVSAVTKCAELTHGLYPYEEGQFGDWFALRIGHDAAGLVDQVKEWIELELEEGGVSRDDLTYGESVRIFLKGFETIRKVM